MSPDPTLAQSRRAGQIRTLGSPMSPPVSPSGRKQRAVLTCEECRRKKIRCTRGRNGVCERCKAQGIPCRQSTAESINAPRIVMPHDLDYSTIRLYHVVQDLQRRLGMTDVDLAQIIRRHCAPGPPQDLQSTPVFSQTHSTPPGSSHGSGSSIDGHYSPFTPPDDEDMLAMAAASHGRSRTNSHSPLFAAASSSSVSSPSMMAPDVINGHMIMIKNEHGPPTAYPAAGFAMPRMPAHYAPEGAAEHGMPTPPAEYVTQGQEWPSIMAGESSSWMLDGHQHEHEHGVDARAQAGEGPSHGSRGGSPSNAAAYLVDFGRDSWST